ncbi:MAG: acyl-CoA dehydrogenase family protein [Acetobacteraceae bacterium]|nr:acyl-CoA dehydrogenase family protein [Acetobacteraceae bacterium]
MPLALKAVQTPPDHPARARAIGPVLESGAAFGDRENRLAPEVLEALYDADLFRMLVPRAIGGAQLDPLDYMATIETLARHDGSAAWCVNQASGVGMGSSHLPREAARAIWGTPRGVACWGPPKPGVTMTAVPGGYRVTYEGSFASGSPHATHIGGFVAVTEADGSPRLMADGKGELRAFLVPIEQAEIWPDWDVIGLRGTGSNAYRLTDVFVPAANTWVRDGDSPDPDPYFRLRATQIWSGGFAAIALGLARGMLDAFLDLAVHKVPRDERNPIRENHVVQHEVALAEAKLASARLYFHDTLARMLDELRSAPRPSLDMRIAYRLAATHAIHSAREAGEMLYDAAGTHSIFNDGAVARRYRDLRTLTQQLNGRRAHYHNVGRHLLGLPPAMIGF